MRRKTKLEVYLDLDETICQFLKPLIYIYNRDYNGNVTMEDITEWSLDKPFRGLAKKIYSSPGFFYNLIPYEGALKKIHILQKQGFPIYLISNPSGIGTIAAEKIEWVKKSMPWFDINNLILTGYKHKFAHATAVLIDDAPMYLDSFREAGGHTICIDKLYNKDCNSRIRVYDNDNDFDVVYDMVQLLNCELTR